MKQCFALVAVTTALSLVPVAQAQAPVDVDHISNWAAPLYWQPTVRNSEVNRGRIRESVIGRAAASSSLGLPALFVAMSPCRVVDTRNPNGPFGGPSYNGGDIRSYAVPSGPCGGIPANAVAFSVNIAVIPLTATMRWLTAWDTGSVQPTASTLNDKAGLIVSNSAVVPAGTGGSISIYVTDPTHVIIDINGYYLPPTDLANNTQIGTGALASFSSSGSGLNTAVGFQALNADTTGPNNTAVGSDALLANTSGSTNTAVGSSALPHNTTGSANTAVGVGALSSNTTGLNNTAVGDSALSLNTTGTGNTAVGYNALASVTGSNNFALGNNSGTVATTGSWNVFIANQGQTGDTNLIRIGDSNQTKTYIAGIATTGVTGSQVYVNTSTGQLGILSSSRRFKQDIQDMGDTTETLMSLHPVQFRYKEAGSGSPLQYGLIAEDVAEVNPDLVERTPKGEILTVHYEKVNAMVLNQVQEQQRLIDKQNAMIQQLESRISELENRGK